MDLISEHKYLLGAGVEEHTWSSSVCRLRFRLSSGWSPRQEAMSLTWTWWWHHPGEWALTATAGAGDSGGVWDYEDIIFKKIFYSKSDGTLKLLALRWYGVSASEDIKNLSGCGPWQPALVHTAQARMLDKATCRDLVQIQLFCDFVNIKGSTFFASQRAVFKHFPTNKSLNQRKWTIILL